jgi:hypothetical protein
MLSRLASIDWPLQLQPETGVKVPEKAGPAAMVTVPFSAPVWLVHAGRVKSVESSPSSFGVVCARHRRVVDVRRADRVVAIARVPTAPRVMSRAPILTAA